jgi:hypothetical protein
MFTAATCVALAICLGKAGSAGSTSRSVGSAAAPQSALVGSLRSLCQPVALPRMRRTIRLADAQRRIAFSAGGEGGARLARTLAMPVSGDTMLRLIRASPLPHLPAPRVVGIDDWAWRRGQRYGTLIVDLERNRPLDLLPDRDAQTVATWLRRHLGIEVVARDCAGAYAEGIRRGAPAAVQVADRWHLLRNLGDSVARALERHGQALRAAAIAVPEINTAPSAPITPVMVSAEPKTPDPHALRRTRFNDAIALHAQGYSARGIARTVGVNRQTVQGWLRSGELPTSQQTHRGSSVDRHAEHLDRRWNEGCLRWSRPIGQFGGRVKLGPGCCQAAILCITPAPYASSGVRPANVE